MSDSDSDFEEDKRRKNKRHNRRHDDDDDASNSDDDDRSSRNKKKKNNNNNNKKRYNKDGEDAKKLDPLDPSTGKIEPGSFDTRLSLVDNIATLVEKEKAVLQLQLEEKEKALLDTQNLLKQLSKYSIPYI